MPDPAEPPAESPEEEEVALYDPSDPQGRVVGHAPRSRMRAENLPHAATSVVVRDAAGRFYVHRRTDTKDVFPGAHDIWAGGVVTAGEDPADAAVRELAEELGLTGLTLRPLFREWYADEHTTYLAHIYETEYDEPTHGPIRHQPEEVADGWWMTLDELLAHLADPDWAFVPDGRHCFDLYLSRGFAAGTPGGGAAMKSDLRTVAVCWLIDRSGRERVEAMSLEQIRKRRGVPIPHWWPASLLTGSVASGVRLTDRELPLPEATLPARVYTPVSGPSGGSGAGGPLPLVVYFHGGGWVLGHLASYDALCSRIAAQVGAVVVSVGYRLAPEHPMPTAAEDAYAATVWLAAHAASFGADGSRVAVAGDSAGGNLAAVVALLARDRGGPSIAHQVLIYPATDGTLSSPSLEENADGPILTLASVRAYRAHYLGPDGDERDVRLSPLLAADLTGLPPALIQGAELDPIRDDARRYAAALSAAGNDVRYSEYVAAPHGYLSIPGAVRGSRQALAEVVDQLKVHLHQGF